VVGVRRSLKLLIALLAGALLAPAIVVSAATSSAQIISNSGRNFTLRYSNNINGQDTPGPTRSLACLFRRWPRLRYSRRGYWCDRP
jgi:hypothetical protein